MGALPRIKKKKDLNYRKGSTNETQNCRYCVNYLNKVIVYNKIENRCKIMGENPSARYRIRPDFTCDAQSYNGK